MVVTSLLVAGSHTREHVFGTDLISFAENGRSTLVDLPPGGRVNSEMRAGVLRGTEITTLSTALLSELPRGRSHRRRMIKPSPPGFPAAIRCKSDANIRDVSTGGGGERPAALSLFAGECRAEWAAYFGRDLRFEEILLAELARALLPGTVALPAGQSATGSKWSAARLHYAATDDCELGLGLVDTTIFGTATHGVALSTAGMYWRGRFAAPQFLRYHAIRPNAVRTAGRTIQFDTGHWVRLAHTSPLEPSDLARFVQLASALTILSGRPRDDGNYISALSVVGSALAHGELAGALARAARGLINSPDGSSSIPTIHGETGFAARAGIDWNYSC